MRIGVRIASGFVAMMLLTLAVAGVGWLGLRDYSRRVAASSAAQSLVRDIDRLRYVTDQVVRGAAPDLASIASLQVEAAVGGLKPYQFDRIDRSNIERLRASLLLYQTIMRSFESNQGIKNRLVAERKAVADQLVEVARQVSDLQAARFDTAISQLKNNAIDLKTTADILEIGLQFENALSGVHDQTARFVADPDPDQRRALLLQLDTMDVSIADIALRLPSETVLQPLRRATAGYRMMISAPGPVDAGKLQVQADIVESEGSSLYAGFSTGIIDAVGNLDDARDLAATAAAGRQIAQQIIVFSQQAAMAERDFLRVGSEAAAGRVRQATQRMQVLVKILAGDVPDADVHKVLSTLRSRITEYDADFDTIVDAQRVQPALLGQVLTSMDDMLRSADLISENQLRRMAEGHEEANGLIYGGTLLALMISMTFSYLIACSIIRPIGRIVAVMRRLASGERVAEIPGGERHDELRDVADAVKVFRDNMVAMDRLTQKLDRARLQQLADVSFEGIVIHHGGTILNVNEALCAMLGRPREHLIDHYMTEFVVGCDSGWLERSHHLEPSETITGEVELLDAAGSPIPTEFHARRIDYSGRAATAVAVRDLTARRQAEAKLVHLARHDPLTKLANRLLLSERLTQAVATASRVQGGLAVLCLDLDRFKAVNDQFGHAAGDDLLIQVSQRLASLMQPGDTVARMGGDEFAILITAADPARSGADLSRSIIESLSSPFTIMRKQVVVGASVGVALHPANGEDGLALLRSADIAMYRAKAEGRNAFRFYDAEMDQRLQVRHALEHDLRRAIQDNELELHYQPLTCCVSGEISGFEALARWNHPEHGTISPKDFILMAEETGQIDQLGSWALRTACAEAATWSSKAQIAVNLSPIQFRQHDLPQQIAETLARTGLSPDRLEIEVTEGVLIDDPDRALRLLSEIKRLGVRISLDDFGTGYSSLNYLQRFPFDKIKIDRSFITNLGESRESIAIVRAIIALGHSLKLTVIAEGVETRQQHEILRLEKCNQLQGYLFGRPMPRQALAALAAVRLPREDGRVLRADRLDPVPVS